jgi:hypothetical protein
MTIKKSIAKKHINIQAIGKIFSFSAISIISITIALPILLNNFLEHKNKQQDLMLLKRMELLGV